MQQEILDLEHILLMGDFNSRVKNLPDVVIDFVQIDKHMGAVYGLYDLYEESTNVLKYFESYNIPLDRNSADNTVNSYKNRLLDFCKNNNIIFISNGRLGTDHGQQASRAKNSSTLLHLYYQI